MQSAEARHSDCYDTDIPGRPTLMIGARQFITGNILELIEKLEAKGCRDPRPCLHHLARSVVSVIAIGLSILKEMV